MTVVRNSRRSSWPQKTAGYMAVRRKPMRRITLLFMPYPLTASSWVANWPSSARRSARAAESSSIHWVTAEWASGEGFC